MKCPHVLQYASVRAQNAAKWKRRLPAFIWLHSPWKRIHIEEVMGLWRSDSENLKVSECVRKCIRAVCTYGRHPSKMIPPLAKLSDRFPENIDKFFDTRLLEPRTPPNERGDCQLQFGYTLIKNGSTSKKLWVFKVQIAIIWKVSECVSTYGGHPSKTINLLQKFQTDFRKYP